MFLNLGGEGGDLAIRRLGDGGRLAAIDEAGGQLEQDILDARPRRLRQQGGQSRANTGQGDDVLEQGKEDFGSHGLAL